MSDDNNDNNLYEKGMWFHTYDGHKMMNADDEERREFDFDTAVKWFEACWEDEDFTIGVGFLLSAMFESFVRKDLARMDVMPANFDQLKAVYLDVLSNMQSTKDDSQDIGLPTTLSTPKDAIIH